MPKVSPSKPNTHMRTSIRLRQIIMLILISLVSYGAFIYWTGDPLSDACTAGACESRFPLSIWILAFFMMITAVVIGGSLVGLLLSVLRRRRGHHDGGIADLINQLEEDKPD